MSRGKPGNLAWRTKVFGLMWGAALSLLLSACVDKKKPEYLGAPIGGYNHTSAAINRFSVNRGGGPNLGPYGGGNSQTCCVTMPVKWRPGMKVTVKWEKDLDPFAYADWPEKRFSKEWTERSKEHKTHYIRNEATVEVIKYDALGEVDVHFLPCDQIKVTAGTYTFEHPKYPLKIPRTLEEPKTCPAVSP